MINDGRVDETMYHALETRISLDGALDRIECMDVAASWAAAERRNADRLNALKAGRDA